jgi:pilus assembly protein CpaF
MTVFGRRGRASGVQEPEKTRQRHLVHESAVAPQLSAESIDDHVDEIKTQIFSTLLDAIDLTALNRLPREVAEEEIGEVVGEILQEIEAPLSVTEQEQLVLDVVHDTMGLGPLEILLNDDEITDILVNSPDKVFIEKHGQLQLTPIHFRDTAQLMNICIRIAMAVGRRVDEASPICDARLADGSRVNIIIPPLSIDAPMLTIRKFRKASITMKDLIGFGSVTEQAAAFLRVAVASRANILISGGTGSGKTTLLNALSAEISDKERIITVEDTAELRLQQPHVGRLETRPANLEGKGAITQRDLVKNCLRMRPDRIIVGEVRGGEAFDMLQAMNTGHEGSMSTLHANTPHDSLTRLEDMVALSGFQLPSRNVQMQIASALDLIVQIERLQDGRRVIVNITDVVGFQDQDVSLKDLFVFRNDGVDDKGRVLGDLVATGAYPQVLKKAAKYGRREEMLATLGV